MSSPKDAGEHGKSVPQLAVTARAPFHVYYEGVAEVVSAVNAVGPFDILPGHADFFSVLVPCTVVIRKATGDPESFDIRSGIVTIRDNEVLLFANV